MGCALDGDPTAVLVSFGEGATSTGDWHEGMNFAGVYHAPIIFFCENNQWAISVPIAEQVAGRVSDRAAGYGFPGVRIDGTDALTIYAVVRAAAERCGASATRWPRRWPREVTNDGGDHGQGAQPGALRRVGARYAGARLR
jgi:2-oxoisovalerate dehydrogenase E1 component alpha subunit